MPTCPQYLSGVYNNIYYYYAFICPDTPASLQSPTPLPVPALCQDPYTGCVLSLKEAPDAQASGLPVDTGGRDPSHVVTAKAGLAAPCAAGEKFLAEPGSAVVSQVDVRAKLGDGSFLANVRLFLVLMQPPGLSPLHIAFGQQTAAAGTAEATATPVEKKYFTIDYDGRTYHVLLVK
jgi:hypothetical protein